MFYSCKDIAEVVWKRKYSIYKLLSFEICESFFLLTKDGYISRTNKSEMTRELEKMVKYVPRVSRRPENPETLCEVTTIDFMAYARNVPIKNLKLKTFGEFTEFMYRI